MNNSDDMPGDEVTRAYQRASDAEAGRPAPKTRAAILAEARATSLRRTPAANDSRYVWRAVAGVAVLGVAVLLWKQADRQVSPDLTVAETEPLLNTQRDAAEEAPSAAPELSADRSAAMPAPAPASESGSAAKAEQGEVRPAAPALQERESKRAEESAGAAVASVAAPAANSMTRASADAAQTQAAGAVRQDATDYQLLLQREFPDIWSGDRIANTAWVEMDAANRVVRKGVLSGTETLASIATDRGPWTPVQVKTASGSSLQLAVRNVD